MSAATRDGGALMGLGNELGQVRPGFLADLLLVDGDPLADIAVLQDRKRLPARFFAMLSGAASVRLG